MESKNRTSIMKMAYFRSLAAIVIAVVLWFHLQWFPENLPNELDVWRGLPTAFGHVLIMALVIVSAANIFIVLRCKKQAIK